VFNRMPKDPTFFDQFEHLAICLVNATTALSSFTAMLPEMDGHVAAMEENRHEAHRTMRESLLRLDTAFITPFDREDILELVTQLYKAIVDIATAGRRIEIYHLRDMHPSLQANVSTLDSMAREVNATVHQLRNNPKLPNLRVTLDEIGRLEEAARQHRDQFLMELYEGQPDPLLVMKKREVHDLVLEGIRRCDTLGRTVERILLKND
jgi:uncharacterized protein